MGNAAASFVSRSSRKRREERGGENPGCGDRKKYSGQHCGGKKGISF